MFFVFVQVTICSFYGGHAVCEMILSLAVISKS